MATVCSTDLSLYSSSSSPSPSSNNHQLFCSEVILDRFSREIGFQQDRATSTASAELSSGGEKNKIEWAKFNDTHHDASYALPWPIAFKLIIIWGAV